VTKKYEHIGILPLEIPQGSRTLRVETGELFDADLPVELEGYFLRTGLIREAVQFSPPATATFLTRPSLVSTSEDAEE
jgi:hypothetical protein